MKKLLLIILSLSLIITALFAFTACGVTPPGCTEHTDADGDGICDTEGCGESVEATPGGEEANKYFNENGELILYRDGEPTFHFVKGAGLSGSGPVDDLAAVLSGLSKSPVKTVKATDTADIQDVEIIFGTVTNRGDEYKFDIHTLGLQGYIVKQVGTKIFVVAGSSDYYDPAIKYLKEKVFGITRTTPDFTDLVMSADKNKEAIQDNYAVKDVTLDGVSIRGYTLVFEDGDSFSSNAIKAVQEALYKKTGIWLNSMREDKLTDGSPYIKFTLIENDGKGGGFYIDVDKNKNAVISSEYQNKFDDVALDFFTDNVFADGIKGKVSLPTGEIDYRNVYYEDYGAIGDGIADDFEAIKAAHDDANTNRLIVHANASSTYYIGKSSHKKTITVKTSTYWHGCKFIFDDSEVAYYGATSARTYPVFTLSPDTAPVEYTPTSAKNPLPFTSLEKEQDNIGWEPGSKMMLIIYNANVRHYIRAGANADSGQVQHELIIVDEKGNVSDTTPIQWDYETITSIEAYNIDDREIEINGEGENGKRTLIRTIYNKAPAAPIYYERNITVNRSNVAIKGIEHIFSDWTPYDEGGKGAPYHGIVRVVNSSNVLIENMIYEGPEIYYFVDSNSGLSAKPTGANIGSYSITAECSNNITWRNSKQSNFFNKDGGRKQAGAMGTNFCKNLYFEDMFFSAFDAHCGVYNGSLTNCTVDHINFIGAGDITLNNVTLYVGTNIDGSLNAAINLRRDYGSTWNGDVNIDGLAFKYGESYGEAKASPLCIFYVRYERKDNNHDFGYTCYLPQNVTLKNIYTERIAYSVTGSGNGTSDRQESHIEYNDLPVYLFWHKFNSSTDDYTDLTFGITGGTEKNINPFVPTLSVTHYTAYTGKYANLGINKALSITMPTSPTFKNTQFVTKQTEE